MSMSTKTWSPAKHNPKAALWLRLHDSLALRIQALALPQIKKPDVDDRLFALDEVCSHSYHLFHQSALRSRPWISCRVAEGRALRRHGNRTRIIYPGRQVPTLDPETGKHEIRGASISALPEPLFLFRGKRASYFRTVFLSVLCVLCGKA